jgi:nucleotide-binding universal stress UspA family protein
MEIDIGKILCPVDFSEGSEHAMRYATAFASAYEADLVLLHVVELPFLPSYSTAGVPDLSLPVEQIQEECENRLEDMVEEQKKIHPQVEGRVVVGAPFVEIIREAREGNFDLVVVGTHGRTGLKHMLIGSVAEKVVRKAPCPVLTVKHPEHEFVKP